MNKYQRSTIIEALLLMAASLAALPSNARAGDWAWEAGGKSIVQSAISGPRGVTQVPFVTAPAQGAVGVLTVNRGPLTATTQPGARSGGAAWANGTQGWLFGGVGFDSTGASGQLNDLWSFDPASRKWTLVRGPNAVNNPGVYGTLGTPSGANVPGSRDSAVAVTDKYGNFWLFGGFGFDATGNFGSLSDLWKYDPVAAQWTWVTGSNAIDAPGQYGTPAIAGPLNAPGARGNAVGWFDDAGNLWIFGGIAFDSSGDNGVINDLWKFNPAKGQWTWVGGSKTINAPGGYGTFGVTGSATGPGARSGSTAVERAGKLWLISGFGVDAAGNFGLLNDVWRLNPKNGQWVWVDGSENVDQPGAFGKIGNGSKAFLPGARAEAVAWVNSADEILLFGGIGLDDNGSVGLLNDLWKFDPTNLTWTWVRGSQIADGPAVYGSKGVPARSNTPGPRLGAIAVMNRMGDLTLFGGVGLDATGHSGFLQDLWTY
jgi:N-acetylneuraminic acid mutarotase